MGDTEHVLFEDQNRPLFIVMLILTPVITGAIGFQDGDIQIAATVVAVSMLMLFVPLILIFQIFPQRQLSKLALAGTQLVGYRNHFFDRGERLVFAPDRISGWQARRGKFERRLYVTVNFEHAGERFSFHVLDGAKADRAALARLVPSSAWPASTPLW